MKKSLHNFRNSLRSRLLALLWKQWAQLGVAAGVQESEALALDPEALVLFTCALGRWDPRLFDEMIDWLTINGRFLSLARLKALQKRHSFAGADILAAVAEVVAQRQPRLTWQLPRPTPGREPQPLFMTPDGPAMPAFGPLDETFLRHGWQRGKLEPRGYSQPFDPILPACALLRLRALFGRNARADIMLYLLTHANGHPHAIARAIGFSQKNVQDTLVEMRASGLVAVVRLSGREKHYRILERDRATFLDQANGPPEWIAWAPLFRALEHVWLQLREKGFQTDDQLLLASELRRLLDDIRPNLEAAGFGEHLARTQHIKGEAYVEACLTDLNSLTTAICGPAG